MKSGWLVAVLLILLVPIGWAGPGASEQKKNKDRQTRKGASGVEMPLSDSQAIDLAISEMLGAWQIGNLDLLHKHYSDDVIVISGLWEPPLAGWQKYAQAYQAQRARMESVRLERSNTFIKVAGNFAWATYQWDFNGVVDGKSTEVRGQTSLVLQKQPDGRWLIVLNHTSAAPEAATPVQVPQAAPAKPAAGSGA